MDLSRIDFQPLADAIDRYLAKADDDLKDQLKDEGLVEAAKAVDAINRIEDSVRQATQGHVDSVLDQISTEAGLDQFLNEQLEEVQNADDLKAELKQIFRNEFDELARQFTFSYVIAQDPDLDTTDRMITEETQDTITQWSNKLADSTAKWVEPKTVQAVTEAVKKVGRDVNKVTEELYNSGVRDTEWKARRLATTEVLRMESIGQEESFTQNPSAYAKRWKHRDSGHPRENHIAMDGQTVLKREPFVMQGRDGGTYYPMYPRDPILPAGESINCHCTMEEVVDKEVLGMTDEERSDLRHKAMEEVNARYDEEHGTDNIKAYKSLSKKEQLAYFGGQKNKEAQAYRSLINSGVISNDDKFKTLYKTDETGRRKLKTLDELNSDGIFTVNSDRIDHSVNGHWPNLANTKKPIGGKNGGVLDGGGHGYETISELRNKGVEVEIKNVYSNGVTTGGYKWAHEPQKKLGESGMAWFPNDWNADKIADAGTFAVNMYAKKKPIKVPNTDKISGYRFLTNYDGVTVGAYTDPKGNIQTIFPDYQQRLLKDKDD